MQDDRVRPAAAGGLDERGGGESPAEAIEALEPVDLGEARVLIVDDNEQNLELMQAYLEELPCAIDLARDGVEAMRRVDEHRPDMVILDVMMPKMSGFEVCHRIKADPATRGVVVVMVTALNEVADVERALESGTDEFLTKPVNRLELITRVRSLLRVVLLKRQVERLLAERDGA